MKIPKTEWFLRIEHEIETRQKMVKIRRKMGRESIVKSTPIEHEPALFQMAWKPLHWAENLGADEKKK